MAGLPFFVSESLATPFLTSMSFHVRENNSPQRAPVESARVPSRCSLSQSDALHCSSSANAFRVAQDTSKAGFLTTPADATARVGFNQTLFLRQREYL
jgi:hypothetical protein